MYKMRKLILLSFVTMMIIPSQKLFAHKFTDRNEQQKITKFKGTDKSLKTYQCPEWFRDAKFGIWAVWGPSAVPEMGDWFAKKMYMVHSMNRKTRKYDQGPSDAYLYMKKTYGPQSKFGFKDLIPLWKAEKFNPETLMKLYKEAGAKYFCSIASHHDNFFLWNSKLHRWNSTKMGPHRDIIGDWQKAAKKEGLKFGVTEHLGASYTWYQSTKTADDKGKYKGIPYDTNDPKYADLYHTAATKEDNLWMTNNREWQQDWSNKITELVDMYHPDLLYSDSELPFGKVGKDLVAHFYNTQLDKKGHTKVVYNCKHDVLDGAYVKDYERGSAVGIRKAPWQTDTSIGAWVYRKHDHYKTATQIIQMLVDIVSKNGNLLLNVAPTPEGTIDDKAIESLKAIGLWLKDNGDAIYSSRPWDVYGEGPSMKQKQTKGQFDGVKDVRPYTDKDIRFTTRKKCLYAFVMNHIDSSIKDIKIKSLINKEKKVKSVRLLSNGQHLDFKQSSNGLLTIKLPNKLPKYAVSVYEIRF